MPSRVRNFVDYGHRHKSVKPAVSSVLSVMDEYSSGSGSNGGRGAWDITAMYPTEELRAEHREVYDKIVPWIRNERGQIDEVNNANFHRIKVYSL